MTAELTKRVASSLVLIPAVLSITYLGGFAFNVLILIAGLIMLFEWLELTERRPLWKPLGLLYILIPCISLVWLRGLAAIDDPMRCVYPSTCANSDVGLSVVFHLLFIVWFTDIGAYFAGRAIGGPRIAPSISPNKTWAGLIGGMIAAASVSALYTHVAIGIALIPHAVLGAALAIIAQAGDFFESWVKRRFGKKDSGNLIPGHGGLLDRLDGLMFVAPAALLVILLRAGT